MDVIALHQAGFINSVAALGTAFTGFHASLLKRYTSEVLLTFDSDKAGTQAALRSIPILKDAGLTIKVINMNPYKDPDEFIKVLGSEEFKKRISEARNSFFFEIDVLQKNYDLNDPEQKTKFFHETAKKLLNFSDELERNFYIDSVAKNYNIDVEQLRKLVNRLGSQLGSRSAEQKDDQSDSGRSRKNPESGIMKSQKLMLTWLIEDFTLFEKIKGILGPEDFTEGIYSTVAGMVFDQYDKEHAVNPARIINFFQSKEEQSEVAALFSAGIRGDMDEAGWQKALSDTVFRLKENSLDVLSKKAIEVNDTALLQKIIAQKQDLKKRSSFLGN
jgi:DNA primase